MKNGILALIVLSMVFLMGIGGCGQAPATGSAVTDIPAEQTVEVKQTVPDCTLLNTQDAKTIFKNSEVTQNAGNSNENNCAASWTSWKVEGTSRTTLNRAALAVTNTVKTKNQNASDSISRVCINKASLDLGEYGSCNIAGDIFFGKGDYMIEVQCVNCPGDAAVQFANLANSRL